MEQRITRPGRSGVVDSTVGVFEKVPTTSTARPLAGRTVETLSVLARGCGRAHRSVAVPGFPNMFMLMCPHSPIGNQSSGRLRHVVDQPDRDGRVVAAAPTEAATKDCNENMKATMPQTIWASGCSSWYLGKDGLPELFPWTPERHHELPSHAGGHRLRRSRRVMRFRCSGSVIRSKKQLTTR